MNDAMIEAITFTSLNPGPRLIVLGAVHGNEKCGTHAIHHVIQEIKNDTLKLQRGAITFVPVCNPRGFKQNTRWVERNLNRFLTPQTNPDCYEAQIGNVLCPILSTGDALLDLHSYHHGKRGSFGYLGTVGSKEHDFMSSLGADFLVTGWAAAYQASGREKIPTHPDESVGTTDYIRRVNPKAIAGTLECGQHDDPKGIEVGRKAIHHAVAYFGLGTSPLPLPGKTSRLIELKNVIYFDDGGSLAQKWEEMSEVKKGELLATTASGRKIIAPNDGFIVLPNPDPMPNAEWFYFGQYHPGYAAA